MAFPSLKAQAGPEAPEPLEQVSRLILEGTPEEPGLELVERARRLVGALAASGLLHAFAVLVLVIAFSRLTPPALPTEELPVPLTFVKPEPLPAPLPSPRAPAGFRPSQQPPRLSPQEMKPGEKSPIEPPIGPLPEPNRMGEQVPMPPPPKPSKGPPPPESASSQVPPGEQRQRQSPPPQLGAQEGSGKDLPGGPAGSGAESSSGRTLPQAEKEGTLPLPSFAQGLGKSTPGTGGEGSRIPGPGKKAPRRGVDYGVPFDTGVYGNFTFEHQDFDWTDYWSVMYWAIWRAWHNKLYLGTAAFERVAYERGTQGLAGTAVLRFAIERNGNVSDVEILTPSGIQPLDLASSDALKEVILPPLPANFPHEREHVTGSFIMDVSDVREWRPYMEYLKRRGVF